MNRKPYMGVCKVLLKQITVMMIALAIRMVKYRRRKMTEVVSRRQIVKCLEGRSCLRV